MNPLLAATGLILMFASLNVILTVTGIVVAALGFMLLSIGVIRSYQV